MRLHRRALSCSVYLRKCEGELEQSRTLSALILRYSNQTWQLSCCHWTSQHHSVLVISYSHLSVSSSSLHCTEIYSQSSVSSPVQQLSSAPINSHSRPEVKMRVRVMVVLSVTECLLARRDLPSPPKIVYGGFVPIVMDSQFSENINIEHKLRLDRKSKSLPLYTDKLSPSESNWKSVVLNQ